MTREEEINNAAENNTEIECYSNLEENWEDCDITDAFIAGAKWADKNQPSPWIKAEDDLPCNHEKLINPKDETETIPVLANIGGIVGITKMVKNSHTSEWIWATRVTVYYWMPIPEFPKE